MDQCLVTGGTGFLGKNLIPSLLQKGCQLTVLIRNPELLHVQKQIGGWRALSARLSNNSSVEVWCGDLSEPCVGLAEEQMLSKFSHIFHLAAIYDLKAEAQSMLETNVQGTEHLLESVLSDGFTGRFHFISSIAVAGDFVGVFDEDMFDEGQAHSHAYHLSKFRSEESVRRYRHEHGLDIRIYRPSAIVGDSTSGEIDKLDGPYYMFLLVSSLKRWLPTWAPLVIPKLQGILDIVPVDYVVNALVELSFMDEDMLAHDQFCFHLTDPNSFALNKTFKAILKSADGPRVSLAIPFNLKGKYGVGVKQITMMKQLKAVQIVLREVLARLGLPESVFEAMMPEVKFSADKTLSVLSKVSVRPPPFHAYVDNLWDYYNRHLDPAKNRDTLAKKAFSGKKVLITGGSSGIGFASAQKALSYGAGVILVARHEDKLADCITQLSEQVKPEGLVLDSFACDLSIVEEGDRLVSYIEEKYGTIDILFNNAGRSIRRSISSSQGRFHDLQRTMQLNYFGAARLMLGLLPSMIDNGGGHILHSSSMGTMAATPRFGPYMASKSALDTLMDSIAAEYADRDMVFTSIKFPLVKTQMVAPTAEYQKAPLVSPESAAQMFVDAVIDQPRNQLSGMGVFLGTMSLYAPDVVTKIYNYLYQVWPDAHDDFPGMAIDRALVTSVFPHSPL
jgi:NAD(P)-dependent dehydrogenase (short-subunit alcohol dehydrogenase family)